MLLLIDNYDSFTYNLVQYLGAQHEMISVHRNDAITLEDIHQMQPSYIVISPGPCSPNEAGISVATIRAFAEKIPILGVCLGHQSIGQAFGGAVVRAARPMHGKLSPIHHDERGVFAGLPNPFIATRYHSLVIERAHLPSCLEVSAWTEEGEIMGVRHKIYQTEGVQFHPESIMSQYGHELIANFLGRPISQAANF